MLKASMSRLTLYMSSCPCQNWDSDQTPACATKAGYRQHISMGIVSQFKGFGYGRTATEKDSRPRGRWFDLRKG